MSCKGLSLPGPVIEDLTCRFHLSHVCMAFFTSSNNDVTSSDSNPSESIAFSKSDMAVSNSSRLRSFTICRLHKSAIGFLSLYLAIRASASLTLFKSSLARSVAYSTSKDKYVTIRSAFSTPRTFAITVSFSSLSSPNIPALKELR